MTGIYKIENLLSGEVYIGQSTNIEQRFKEHIYHSSSYIDENISEIGVENFNFQILEICSENDLDEREEFYIDFYKSNVPGFGYNLTSGAKHGRGTSNSNAKLSEKDVYDIREAYKNHEDKFTVFEKYKHLISKSYFSSIWEGSSWKHIHFDVYNEENLNYYKFKTSLGEKSKLSKFSNNEVYNLRKRYVHESAREIYLSVKDKCSFNSLQSILWGRYYKNIPIYDKRNKKWIYNEACIDYPREEE